MRRTAAVAVTVLALVSLSGCFKLDMDMTVNSDDTLDGVVILAINEQLADMAEEDSDLTEEDLPEGATIEEYDEDGFVGQKVTLDDVSMADLNESFSSEGDTGGPGEWSLTHEGDEYRFTGDMDLTDLASDEDSEIDMGAFMAGAELRVAFTFPGEVTESNGEVDGNTVDLGARGRRAERDDRGRRGELRAVGARPRPHRRRGSRPAARGGRAGAVRAQPQQGHRARACSRPPTGQRDGVVAAAVLDRRPRCRGPRSSVRTSVTGRRRYRLTAGGSPSPGCLAGLRRREGLVDHLLHPREVGVAGEELGRTTRTAATRPSHSFIRRTRSTNADSSRGGMSVRTISWPASASPW